MRNHWLKLIRLDKLKSEMKVGVYAWDDALCDEYLVDLKPWANDVRFDFNISVKLIGYGVFHHKDLIHKEMFKQPSDFRGGGSLTLNMAKLHLAIFHTV